MLQFIDQGPEPGSAATGPTPPPRPQADPLASLALPSSPAADLGALAIRPFDAGAMEQDLGEVAGLKPLPINRMHRQAGRPMRGGNVPRDLARVLTPEDLANTYRAGANNPLRIADRAEALKRNQRNAQVVLNWDPLEAQWREWENRNRANPRSRTVAPSPATFDRVLRPMVFRFHSEAAWAGAYASRRGEAPTANKYDVSEFVDDKNRLAIKNQLFLLLDAKKLRQEAKMTDLPSVMQVDLRKLGNDLLYEYNARRRQNTVDMLQLSRDTIKPI